METRSGLRKRGAGEAFAADAGGTGTAASTGTRSRSISSARGRKATRGKGAAKISAMSKKKGGGMAAVPKRSAGSGRKPAASKEQATALPEPPAKRPRRGGGTLSSAESGAAPGWAPTAEKSSSSAHPAHASAAGPGPTAAPVVAPADVAAEAAEADEAMAGGGEDSAAGGGGASAGGDDEAASSSGGGGRGSKRYADVAVSQHPPAVEDHNPGLTAVLDELASLHQAKGEFYKQIAYRRAADSVRTHGSAITSGKEAQALPGIGRGIAAVIDEYLRTGRVAKLASDQASDTLASVRDLSRVHGIGPATASALVLRHGVRDLNDLAARADIHTAGDEGADDGGSDAGSADEEQAGDRDDGGGDQPTASAAAGSSSAAGAAGGRAKEIRLTPAQRVGLQYVREFETPMDRAEADALAGHVRDALASLDPAAVMTVAGAYRRGEDALRDLVIVVSHPQYTVDFQEGEVGQTRSGGFGAGTSSSGSSSSRRGGSRAPVDGHGPHHGPGDLLARLVSELHDTGFLTDDISFGPELYLGVCQQPGHKLSDAHLQQAGCAVGAADGGGGSRSAAAAGGGGGASSSLASEQATLESFGVTSDGAPPARDTSGQVDTERRTSATGWPDALAQGTTAAQCAGVNGAEAAALAELQNREGTALPGADTAKDVLKGAAGTAVGAGPGTAESTQSGLAGVASTLHQEEGSSAAGAGPGVLPSAVKDVLPLHRRITLRYVPFNSYPTAVLDYTGPGDFSRRLRRVAQERGLHLSSYGLRRVQGGPEAAMARRSAGGRRQPSSNPTLGEVVQVDSEEDVFTALGIPYVPPEQRTG